MKRGSGVKKGREGDRKREGVETRREREGVMEEVNCVTPLELWLQRKGDRVRTEKKSRGALSSTKICVRLCYHLILCGPGKRKEPLNMEKLSPITHAVPLSCLSRLRLNCNGLIISVPAAQELIIMLYSCYKNKNRHN